MSKPQDSREAVLNLRRRFADERAELSDQLDPRDVTRVERDDVFLQHFLDHKRGNQEEAFKMLVGALEWRKSLGVNDISLQTIEPELVQAGMCYTEGEDRQGNQLIIINVHMHKKDPEKLPKLKQFMIYLLECFVKKDPQGKLTLIFDVSSCGISNMDLDFIRFVIDCFKSYYPNILAYILVFEMPYLLQAVWSVIKGWLSEAGRAKIKFVTRGDIQSYIASEQLLVHFGGTNQWLYSPDEALAAFRRIESGSQPQPEPVTTTTDGGAARRVHFADSGESTASSSSTGSKAQKPPTNLLRARSLDSSADGGSTRTQQQRQVQQLLANQQRAPASSSSSGRRAGLLDITPSETLEFSGSGEDEISLNLTLMNISTSTVGFKVKTTAPDHYRVKPSAGVVSTGASATVAITLLPATGSQNWNMTSDKFLIEASPVPTSTSVGDLSRLWRTMDRSSMTERRLRAVLAKPSQEPPCPLDVELPKSKEILDNGELTALRQDVQSLRHQVTTLTQEQRHLSSQLEHTNRLANHLLSFLLMCAVFLFVHLTRIWQFDSWL